MEDRGAILELDVVREIAVSAYPDLGHVWPPK